MISSTHSTSNENVVDASSPLSLRTHSSFLTLLNSLDTPRIISLALLENEGMFRFGPGEMVQVTCTLKTLLATRTSRSMYLSTGRTMLHFADLVLYMAGLVNKAHAQSGECHVHPGILR